ncbi:hypothetical protein AMS68_005337 [Peltaster fructicola]|uniref:COP9 signalosome complex subunit 3 N-terminal helical repeats domain-containing protein n=1 Tax=Peltaster fructicola TaxID=286661 RepID=A0A6H0XZI5_9PEZI|nr:hypothetical protein AMS68_005337 [Peltaster fructicola]
MDEQLSYLLSFPPEQQVSPQEYDKQATAYAKHITNLPPTALRTKSNGKNLLEQLDPATHAIPYMCCLLHHLRTPGVGEAEFTELMPYIGEFLRDFDPIQVRYAGAQWRALISAAVDVYRALRIPDVSPIGHALLRLDPTGATFTSNHITYLVLCLQAGTPSKALCILDKNIYAYPSDSKAADELASEDHELSNSFITEKSSLSAKLNSANVLEYYLLGAGVYIGLRRWTRARLFLEFIILHPAAPGITSALQVEAYKKWLLIGLVSTGRTFPYPRTAGQQVMKAIRAVARSYDALAETFEKRDWRKFDAEKDVGTDIWTRDGNVRLVNEAATALLRYRVADLQNTYTVLPISRVATHLGFSTEQTTALVTDLIQRGQLPATLESSTADATLRFAPVASTTFVDDTAIEAQTQRIEDLLQHVRDANRRLQLTKDYIEFLRRSKRQGLDGDPADQMDLEWNVPGAPTVLSNDDDDDENGDEDIMA